MTGTYVHPADESRDGEAAEMHARAARDQHDAGNWHDTTACGLPHKFARVAVTMGRTGWGRHAGHSATLGTLTGRGVTVTGALADLGRLITEACQRDASDVVSFKYDAANSQLWVAVPDVLHDGYTGYAVDVSGDQPAGARMCVSGTGRARDAWSHAVGMADLPDRAAPRALPPMPAEVREMLDKAGDALFALQRYTHQGETELAMRDALADLADYVSGQYAPSELGRTCPGGC